MVVRLRVDARNQTPGIYLQEQPALLTAEMSFQPLLVILDLMSMGHNLYTELWNACMRVTLYRLHLRREEVAKSGEYNPRV